jgi:ParB-like chromosome segregation protein Spo0J
MEVTLVSIDDVRPYEKNPRVNDAAVDAVAASIRQFGFRVPIVVDQDMVIVCGHTRWKAAKKLGLKQVPVHIAKDLTPDQVKAFRIADNQTNTLADWDYDLLPLELKDLQTANFDLSLLGFGADELAELLAPDGTEGLTDPDEVPEPPAQPITKPGDLWLLGAHTTCPHCGEVNEL